MTVNATPRLVLYSHDTMGLGHTRRNLLIAQALSESRTPPAILMIFGANEARKWDLPTGVECLTLPAVKKSAAGGYTARRIPLPFDAIIRLRRQAISAAVAAFDPDLLIVDKVPGGLAGELLPTLRQLNRRGSARIVLGLRDVLDEPSVVRSEWTREGNYRTVADLYHAIWVYGDPAIADSPAENGFGPELMNKLHYTGYLDPRRRTVQGVVGPDPVADVTGPIGLCLVGGGQDGGALARAFVDALLPAGMTGVVVTGPDMPDPEYQALAHRADARSDLRVLRFVTDADALIARASRVVAMGGYNTTVEILSYRRPALIVPRVSPRAEQLIRAARLSALGMVDLLHPDQATGAAISAWLAGPPPAGPSGPTPLDFGGLNRVSLLARTLLASRRARRPRISHRPLLAASAG